MKNTEEQDPRLAGLTGQERRDMQKKIYKSNLKNKKKIQSGDETSLEKNCQNEEGKKESNDEFEKENSEKEEWVNLNATNVVPENPEETAPLTGETPSSSWLSTFTFGLFGGGS
jgi:hypothetical protein